MGAPNCRGATVHEMAVRRQFIALIPFQLQLDITFLILELVIGVVYRLIIKVIIAFWDRLRKRTCISRMWHNIFLKCASEFKFCVECNFLHIISTGNKECMSWICLLCVSRPHFKLLKCIPVYYKLGSHQASSVDIE